jgi:hypothetical protein
VASLLDDPDRRRDLLDHLRLGSTKAAAAKSLGVSRPTLDRWIDEQGHDFRTAVVDAMDAARAFGAAARVALRSDVNPTDAIRPPTPSRALGPARVVIDAEPVEVRPQGPDGEAIIYGRAAPSREGRMTREEVLDHVEYALRHPDHPLCRDAGKMLFGYHFEPDIIRARRLAGEEPVGSVRQKVLREPIPNREPEAP